jgi:uncharacterized protein (TIGR03435 family)
MGQPVIDKTPESMPGFMNIVKNRQQESQFPTIFEALHRLGLELKHGGKVPVKYLVVDSALQVPIGN